ncbi:ABC transporter ATP-binding protein [Halobaculum marinum]|uniref:ABC-type D-xylose/L-arabinose transporter n=1 Tax=Halobaculum marinum TaxID=3031996 RepID=A0ABD5WZT6_9EURY|nr:sn-glycerol-3-phosphate ABC transporter ATP-binding protein UgpC [Halobaculum sp. DT55]
MSDTSHEETIEQPTADEHGEHPEGRRVSLRLDGVTKEFTEDDGGTVVAVDDVSLDVYDGEFIVLVGPSGCGKTTTLRTVAGLEQPTRGSIIIDGEDVSGQEPRERDVAMVFQNYALYPHKTVRDNIAFPLQIRKFPSDEIDERVNDTASMLGIGDLLDRRPSDLSGGQQQRVALGRAIVRDPELFLFDEPLSNLDAKLRIQMRTELNRLHRRVGKTSLYVTHDQAEAMTLSDRVVVMNDGEIQQVAPPEEVYAEPANRFVAGFIGEPPMNFFDVTVEERDGTRVAVGDSFEVALPETLTLPPDAGTEFELGVRPEDFEDASLEPDPDPSRTMEVHVGVVEPMGPNKDLAVRPVGREDDPASEFTARVSNATGAVEGERLTLVVDTKNAHLFDPVSGDNLTV